MVQFTPVNVGTGPDTGDGQTLRSAMQTVNENLLVAATAINGAVAGLKFYATAAARDADTSQPIGTLARVDGDSKVYKYTGGNPKWPEDPTFYAGFTAVVQPIADAAFAAVQIVAGAQVAMPRASVNDLVVVGGQTPAINSEFDAVIISNNTAAANLQRGAMSRQIVGGDGNPIGPNVLIGGTIATFNVSPGGGFVLTRSRFLPGSEQIIGPIRAKSNTVASVLEQIAKAAIAYPSLTDVNELTAAGPVPVVGVSFDVIAGGTSTSASFLTRGGNRYAIINAGGGAIPAGGVVFGKVMTMQLSGGGGLVLLRSRDIFAPTPTATDDTTIVSKRYGNITFDANRVRTITSPDLTLVCGGSSNFNAGYMGAAFVPATVGAAALNEFVPTTGINFKAETVAQPGAPMVTIASQINASTAIANGTARWFVCGWWMNDARTLFYHDQGGIEAEIAALEAGVINLRERGIEAILVLGFDADPRSSTSALDPNWYADTRAFPDGGSTRGMSSPVPLSAPVDPETQMTPPASQALTEPRAWTRTGVKRQGYTRIDDVNRRILRLAAKYDLVVWDLHTSAMRNVFEMVAALGDGLDRFFDKTNPLHPKDAFYEAAVNPVIREWALAVAQGDTTKRIFTGETQAMLQLPLLTQSELGSATVNAGKLARINYDGSDTFVAAVNGLWKTLLTGSTLAKAFNFALGNMPSGASVSRAAGSWSRTKPLPGVPTDRQDFSPAEIFATGRGGTASWWYDVSDRSTLWRDNARTIQAAVGDRVRVVDDKSGNGRHWRTAGDDASPFLRTVSGRPYLEFNLPFSGAIDGMTVAYAGAANMDVFMGFAPDAAERDWIHHFSVNGGSNYIGATSADASVANSPEVGMFYVNRIALPVPATRAQLRAATVQGLPALVELRNADLSGWTANNFGNYGSFEFQGGYFGSVCLPVSLMDEGSNRQLLNRWLAQRTGVSNTIQETGTAADVGRFDYDCLTALPRGLLLEPTRTNYMVSDAASAPLAQNIGSSFVPNTGYALDGSITADRMVNNADTNGHGFALLLSSPISDVISFSAVAQPAGLPRYGVRSYDGSKYFHYSTFDLRSGTGVDNNATSISMTEVGDGRFRCSSTGTAAGNVQAIPIIEVGPDGWTVQQISTGDGVSGVLLSNLQVEKGVPTSFIPALNAPATRPAETLTLDWGSLGVADGNYAVRYTFDDNSTQSIATTITNGKAVVPLLNRWWLKRAEIV